MTTKKTVKSLAVGEHLWSAVEQMAEDMGVEPDAIVSQALFTLARLNGYVVPGQPTKGAAPKEVPRTQASDFAVVPQSAETLQAEDEGGEDMGSDAASGNSLFDEPAALPSDFSLKAAPPQATEIDSAPQKSLFLSHKGAHPVEVMGDRFVLGRGKHCNFVIDSTRVSREHAVIVREGNELFIEDLKSSNGTWYNKSRIAKRRINDGDEFMLGSEPVKCSFKVARR